MVGKNFGALTDAQARNYVIKALRTARKAHRAADTAGESFEREIDRLIKRKTRINSQSLVTLNELYIRYQQATEAIQGPLTDANYASANF